jgi:hypothetical protein
MEEESLTGVNRVESERERASERVREKEKEKARDEICLCGKKQKE